jgi:hypothetical protein
MSLRLNWVQIKEIYNKLIAEGADGNDELVCVVVGQNAGIKEVTIKVSDFLRFMWKISDMIHRKINSLIIKDSHGRIIYTHKNINKGNEEIPRGGNANVVSNWNALNPDEREVYLTLMIAQINGYGQ